ncbi:hypothetical protein [Micromonospora chokoriensis]|uniref:hypothetical protein n=1 Tax=Micromonospora chokoriensis TaxID=356851 RepID=UPI0012FCE9E0|nr:hypothetical protein [Micromonospora chokoriensis]
METTAMERIDALRFDWDVQDGKAYRGARRAGRARRKRGAAALLLACLSTVVLAVMIGVVAMPAKLGSSAPLAGPSIDAGMPMVPVVPQVSDAPLGSATTSPTAAVPSTSGTPSPTGSAPVHRPTTPGLTPPLAPTVIPSTAASVPPPTVQPFRPVTVQAEDPRNELHGDAQAVGCPTCDGGARVRYILGASYLVANLTMPVAGTRTVTVKYESADYRPLKISVNGAAPLVGWGAGGGDWETPLSFTVTMHLPAGPIRMKLYHDTDPAMDIDSVTIS